MKVVARVRLGVKLSQDCCGRKVVALNTGVGANSDVLNTDQIPYVVVVITTSSMLTCLFPLFD